MSGEIPGIVVANPRGLQKRSVSNRELTTGEPDSNRVEWIASYSSLSFNPFGQEFSDGGINEAGLTVNEMTLGETAFPPPDGRPVLFMSLWMQYVLDRFATVDEVLRDLDSIAIDGWAWHFLLTDRTGAHAVLEFLDGKVVVIRDQDLEHLVLCNTRYETEMRNASRYETLGGDISVDLSDPSIERFVHGAWLTKGLGATATVDDAFKVLAAMERGRTQWSWVLDDRSQTVHWRTSVEPRVRSIAMRDLELDPGSPTLAIDADFAAEGEVTHFLEPLDEAGIRMAPRRLVAALDLQRSGDEDLDSLLGNRNGFTERLAEYALSVGSGAAAAS